MSMLLLFPTRREVSLLPDPPAESEVLAGRGHWRGLPVSLIGFGPVDAASGAAVAFLRNPDHHRALLAGLAGTYDEARFPVGSVAEIESFQLCGVGVGVDAEIALPEEIGTPSDLGGLLPAASKEFSGFRLPDEALAAGAALTVCAASATREHAERRKRRFPEATIEEMEGFAVLRAARLAGRQVAALRAVSNIAGDRDTAKWESRAAMDRLAEVIARIAERFQ
jgi:futalosine hydrolase